jgi:hypothetical protein
MGCGNLKIALLSHTLLFLARRERLFRVDWMLGIGIREDIRKQIQNFRLLQRV